MPPPDGFGSLTSAPAEFATTHWSVVLAAGRQDSAEGAAALSQLCQSYWYPLYAFVRRKGYDVHHAQDLTQEFFAQLLKKNYLQDADRQRGRFRTFLLTSLTHFLDNQWDWDHRVKRGGRQAFISFDQAQAEQRWLNEPAQSSTAEKLFDRRWALTVLERSLERLRHECVSAGKAALFDALQASLAGEKQSYPELARGLNLSDGAVKVAAHRLRRRYGELLREEVAQTVASPTEVDEELRHLLAAVS